MANESRTIATTRRTNLTTMFGVGALFPTEQDSVMICSIDNWPKGPSLIEPRLADSLGVLEFRTPPSGYSNGDIPVVRFPEWAFCPGCRRLGPHWTLAPQHSRRCTECDTPITPSRFVVCCERGHIDDFPYREWVHRGEIVGTEGHSLKLTSKGQSSAISDLIVSCSCGGSESLEGAFSPGALRGIAKCRGRRPWLPGTPHESCDAMPRTLQRGSSNVWFSVTRSAISIPSGKARARHFVEQKFRHAEQDASPEELARIFSPPQGCTRQDIIDAVIEMRAPAGSGRRLSQEELYAEEYRALVNGLSDGQDGSDQFLCEEVDLEGSGLPDLIAQVSRVSRLREVRALAGFSRILPTSGQDESGSRIVPITAEAQPTWLPALEVLGEGVFLRLDEEALREWENSPFARQRVRLLLDAQDAQGPNTFTSGLLISGRSLALHSLAHVLLDEFSLTAGYSTASLRERVYDAEGQAGILIYTATADSAGSLGGLAAASDTHRISAVLDSGIRRARWCSSDPVCIESGPTGVQGLNLAACHACLLVAETSCERFNLGLDRATVIGDLDNPTAGLFGDLYL